MNRLANFDKEKSGNSYKNSFMKIKFDENVSTVCDIIYKKLKEYYTGETIETRAECRTIARSFFWTLQDYVEPSFHPTFIKDRLNIPELTDKTVMILYFSVPIANYHYLIVCKSGKNKYKVYNAFGNRFINSFEVTKKIFMDSYRIIQTMTPENVNLDRYIKSWNNIIGMDCDTYLKKTYLEVISADTVSQLIEKLVEKLS